MRTGQRTKLATIGPRLAAGSLICFVLATGCNPPGGTPDPTSPSETNQQPQPRGEIQPQALQEGADTDVNVANFFNDPDGDQLTYSATIQSTNIVSVVRTTGSVVRIRGEGVGSATVVVRATDPAGLSATQDFNVTVTERPVGVCMRTAQVRDAILQTLDVTDCASVARSQLAEIDSLIIAEDSLPGLKADDFELLPGLKVLRLGSKLPQLPPTVFSGLDSLAVLDLANNSLQELPAFAGLSSLRYLELHNNDLAGLGKDSFSELSNLDRLGLGGNSLSTLPPTIFSDLSNLESLDLGQNELQGLDSGVFASRSSLRELDLNTNKLSTLPPTIFSDLSNLEAVVLSNNQLQELPPGVFAGLSKLKDLRLDTNNLSSLPQGVFVGLSELRNLTLEHNPGIPFPLTLRFERTDTTTLSAGDTATVRLVLPEGAPFPITVILSVGANLVSRPSVAVPRGDSVSQVFTVKQGPLRNPVRVTGKVPAVPDAIAGINLVAPDTLVLFGSANHDRIFRDDFNRTGSLDNSGKSFVRRSMPPETSAEALRGEAYPDLGQDVTSWEIRARMGASADSMRTALVFAPTDPGALDVGAFRLDIGRHVVLIDDEEQSVNYRLVALFAPEGRDWGWYWFRDLTGMSNAINDGVGDFTETAVRVKDGEFEFQSYDPAAANPGLVDWIEVPGIPSSSSANADRDSHRRLAQPDFLRDMRAVQEVPEEACLTRKCP